MSNKFLKPTLQKLRFLCGRAALGLAVPLVAFPGIAQPAHAAAADEGVIWRAKWIAAAGAPSQAAGVYHFRKDFTLTAVPARHVVHVSADNRYRLYVNGVEAANGPARGDLLNWRYESVDIAPLLRPGRNVITALVWNYGELKPAAQISRRTAFLLQSDSDGPVRLETDASWKVLTDQAYSFSAVAWPDNGGYYVAGPNEAMDASLYPWDWQRPDADTSQWPAAAVVGMPLNRGTSPVGLATEWQLVPRRIPLPEQRQTRFAEVRRASGITPDAGFIKGTGPLIVPANSKVSLLIDNRQLSMGYPILVASGGAGASATLTYAEAMFDAAGEKGNRNEIAGKTIRGVRDRIRFDGGQGRRFQPLWLRTFRYVQIDIETGAEPLRLDDFHAVFAAYPFEQRAAFSSDARWIDPVWQLDWRALRLSAFETFWDTPYYEQLQYIGDSRIEALLAIYQSGDDRLVRSAIEQFDASRAAQGITLSSYPSSTPQFIPPFSLWWIGMVHDYWMLRDDPAFVRQRLASSRSIIDWFEAHLDKQDMLGAMPWWNFFDWTYPNGVPPGGRTGGSTGLTLQFALALREAAEMEEALGRASEAPRYRALADRLVAGVRAQAWDEGRGLFADTPERKSFGQQANALAILADAVPEDRRRAVMERVLADKSLVQASLYFRFYIDEAMRKAGLADRYLERLEPWRDMLRMGLTATAENYEPTRSDSHAWSAHPNYHLLATVAGIRSGAPGFRIVDIAPALGTLRNVTAEMPHPAGTVRVKLQRTGPTGLNAEITLPAEVPGRFHWHGQTVNVQGRTRLHCDETCRPQ